MSQTVLITGAAVRVGKALAELFAFRGYNVILHCNSNFDAAKVLASGLSEKYPQALFPVVKADLSNPIAAAQQLFDTLPEGISSIDVLINNASVFEAAQLSETPYELYRRQMVINLDAPFFLMQAFYNRFKSGCIINILDTRVTNHNSSHAAYAIAKKALMHLTQMAALEWAPDVRVNAVAPGPVLPPPGADNSHLQRVSENTPLKSTVSLDNLADSAYFLVSNSSVTGQIIFCDSGAHLIS
ncbi:SDR family oxidoreductase [Alkaliflexus imshenetskii]|uniref:SDR family oxidoreductase n=1 Tax=Alkaliflexus imshenetskii TaxID=286730 RepID=UPI00047D23E7|nr:SDR family oxidoreductase [Alkaliflexus imshenetskii]